MDVKITVSEYYFFRVLPLCFFLSVQHLHLESRTTPHVLTHDISAQLGVSKKGVKKRSQDIRRDSISTENHNE